MRKCKSFSFSVLWHLLPLQAGVHALLYPSHHICHLVGRTVRISGWHQGDGWKSAEAGVGTVSVPVSAPPWKRSLWGGPVPRRSLSHQCCSVDIPWMMCLHALSRPGYINQHSRVLTWCYWTCWFSPNICIFFERFFLSHIPCWGIDPNRVCWNRSFPNMLINSLLQQRKEAKNEQQKRPLRSLNMSNPQKTHTHTHKKKTNEQTNDN